MTDPVSSNPSIPVRAGNAFAAKFGREPASASDSAWLNGYAESLTEIERLTRDRDHFQACWNAVAGIRAERDRLRTVVWQMQRYVASPSPCRICGYNGPGFWQPDSHACAALSGEPGSAVETSGEPTDTQRLDWLDSQRRWGDCFMVQDLDSGDVYVRPWRYQNQSGKWPARLVAQTIREVIDAEMRRAEKASGEPT